LWSWSNTVAAAETLSRIRVPGAGGWLKTAADATLPNPGQGVTGAFGQFIGHHFEWLDVSDYNLRHAGRAVMRLREHAHAPGYDASRYIKGRFAGGIQHKFGGHAVSDAVRKINNITPGSAGRATLRVPKDRFEDVTRRAGGRIRVQASRLNQDQVTRRGKSGLKNLAKRGKTATNPLHGAARASCYAAVFSIVLGSALDAPKLIRGDITINTINAFLAGRAVDAAEAGAGAAVSFGVGFAVVSGATSVAGTATSVAAVAGTIAASQVIVPLVTGIVVAAAVKRAARPLRERVMSRFAPEPEPDATGEPVSPKVEDLGPLDEPEQPRAA
jgi:hypothetical protein